MVKIARSVLNLFKKVSFKILLVFQFKQAHLKNQKRYRGKTWHNDWNP